MILNQEQMRPIIKERIMGILPEKEDEVHDAVSAHLWVYIRRTAFKHYPQIEPEDCRIRICPLCWKVEVIRDWGWGEPYSKQVEWEEHLANIAMIFYRKHYKKNV